MSIPIITITDDLSLSCLCGAEPGEECDDFCTEGGAFEDFGPDAFEEPYGVGLAAYADFDHDLF
ncbi:MULTISPECIES: hypothetical protein [unclassified Streptomyces]|uniref:hypothetical protein n=1 Tax=unclassified Streptomyces TaxID=2593676 RepID=UPI0035DE19E3